MGGEWNKFPPEGNGGESGALLTQRNWAVTDMVFARKNWAVSGMNCSTGEMGGEWDDLLSTI